MGYSCSGPSLYERLSQKRVQDTGVHTQLKRCLGLPELVVQGLCHMLGAGVFIVTPAIIQGTAGPATFICYLISGLAAFFSVTCYSDLASRYTCSGSAYVYTYYSVGEFAAALTGFFVIGECFLQPPMSALGMSENVDRFFLNYTLEDWTSEWPWPLGNIEVIAVVVMLVFLIVNLVGITSVAWVNIIAAVISVSCLILCCVISLLYGDVKNLTATDPDTGLGGFTPYGLKGIAQGAGISFMAFVGIESVVCLAEEAKNPKVDIPRATFGSFGVVLVLYVMTSFSLAFFAPWYTLNGTTGLLGAFEDKGFYNIVYIVTGALIFTVFSCGLCTLTTLSRIIYTMAEDGLLFKCLATITARTKVPSWNLLVAATAGILATVFYDFKTLMHMASGGTLLVFTITALSVIIISYDVSGTIRDWNTNEELQPLCDGANNTHKQVLYFLICLYTADVLVLVCLLTFAPFTIYTILLETFLLLLGMTSLCIIKGVIPENPQNATLHFRCPFMPFTPGLCMFINLSLFFNLELSAVKQLMIYVGLGVMIYFGYGVFFSKLTVEKQMLMKKENKDMENDSDCEYECSILEPEEKGRGVFGSCFKGDEDREKEMTHSVEKPKKKENVKIISTSDEDRMSFAKYPQPRTPQESPDSSGNLIDERGSTVNEELDNAMAMDSEFSKSGEWAEINTKKGSLKSDDSRYTYTKYSFSKTPSPCRGQSWGTKRTEFE